MLKFFLTFTLPIRKLGLRLSNFLPPKPNFFEKYLQWQMLDQFYP